MAKIRRFIEVSQIQVDKWPLNRDTLNLVMFLMNNGEVPPIKVQQKPDGNFVIKDGRHRLLAFKLLGRPQIEAKYGDTMAFVRKAREEIRALEEKVKKADPALA